MLKRMLPTAWWSHSLWIVTYVIAADLLPNTLLILANSVGYLPYSDRPGPGWQTPHFPTGQELQFFIGFASLLLPGTALYGVAFAAAGCLLSFCLLPRWGLRVMAAPTAFLAAGLMMAAVGWYIALSSMGVYTTAGCGLLWGIFVFPKLVPRMSRTLPIAAGIALAVVMFVGSTYWLLRPILPDPGLTNAKIEVISLELISQESDGINLQLKGPCCSSMAQSVGPYH